MASGESIATGDVIGVWSRKAWRRERAVRCWGGFELGITVACCDHTHTNGKGDRVGGDANFPIFSRW